MLCMQYSFDPETRMQLIMFGGAYGTREKE